MVYSKESAVSDYYEMWDDSMVWDVSFKRRLRLSKEVQYEELLRLLANVFFCKNSKDSRIWKSSISAEFLAKAFTQPCWGSNLLALLLFFFG